MRCFVVGEGSERLNSSISLKLSNPFKTNGIFYKAAYNKVKMVHYTVSHFSYTPIFQGPHFLTKMLESNILYDNLYIDILSV